MGLIRPTFAEEKIYHVYNRSVEKRDLFSDEDDHFRFIHDLFEFNDTKPASNLYYKSYEIRSRKIEIREPRELLVEILAFCLMPNHFHLLVRQKKEYGISEFMRKLGVGYAMYFNQKYKRSGVLFQGRFKAALIEDDAHFIYLPYYIHLNPLDIKFPEWRKRELKNYKSAIKFLENYRWSSYLDYIGKKNFPSVTSRKFLLEFFNGPKEYQKETTKWLKEMDLEQIKETTLE